MCSGPAVSFAQGKQGCGFGGNGNGGGQEGQKNDNSNNGGGDDDGAAGNEAGAENVGEGNGKQFITGQCLSDADCASGCCAGSEGSDTAACSAKAVANENGKTGCGFQGN